MENVGEEVAKHIFMKALSHTHEPRQFEKLLLCFFLNEFSISRLVDRQLRGEKTFLCLFRGKLSKDFPICNYFPASPSQSEKLITPPTHNSHARATDRAPYLSCYD